jgi:hypothetical protein
VISLRKDLFKGVVLGTVVSTVLMVATTAMAGTGIGAIFNLGKTNTVNAQSTLKGATAAKNLQITNTGSGGGLGISVRAGKAPIVVNASAGKATNLNADKLDGIHSSQLKFIQLPLASAHIADGAFFDTGWGPYAGMYLPDSGIPNFDFGFTLPPTYTAGTALTIRLVWHTSGTSGGISLEPNFISVSRPGRISISGPSADQGLTAVGGNTLSVPSTPNQSEAKLYTIVSPDTAVSLQPGDTVIFGLYRNAVAAGDTATSSLVVQGVSVTY